MKLAFEADSLPLPSPKSRKGRMQRIFHLYPGEERNAALFAFLGFLWAFGASSALKFADALFILHVGAEALPHAYLLISSGMLIIACFLLYAFHRFSPYLIYLTTLLLGSIFYLSSFLYRISNEYAEPIWLWYALKLGGFFLFVILTTCYWTFIDQYHHLRDAKRLYSLFSSMIFLGGATTGLVMQLGILDLNHLLFVVFLLLSATYLWVRYIARKVSLVAHEDAEQEGQVYEQGNSFKFLIGSILDSPFTLLLMTSNFLIYVLLVITEYNYMSTFANDFIPSALSLPGEGTEASLTLFLGRCLAAVSVSNLFFGLFCYSRLIRRFGISSLLIVTPLLLILSFSGWSMSDSLIFPLIGFFVVEGSLYVIDDNNFNLLLNAVPSRLKDKIRVMIESFFEPIGMLMSALLLAFFQSQSKILGLILAITLLGIALALRSRYLQALFFNLSTNAVHFQRSIEDWLSKMNDKQQKIAEERLLNILKFGDEKAQLFACEGLLAFKDPLLLEYLLTHTSQMQATTKMQLIPLLEESLFAKYNIVLDTFQEWIQEDFDLQLKSSIYLYLAKQGLLHPEKVLGDLKSPDTHLKGAAIVALKKSLAYLPPTTAAYHQTLAAEHLALLLNSESEEELGMGLQILGIEGDAQDIDTLISYLSHPSLKVSRTAARSIAQAQRVDVIRQAPLIIGQLNQISDNDVRLSCLKALGQMNDSSLVDELIEASLHFRPNERRLTETIIYNMGLRTVPVLLSITRNTATPDRNRLLAGRILGRLARPQLRANLSDILRQEIERAYFYFYHYHMIQNSYPTLDLTILRDALITGYHSVLDFIIQLLGLAGEVEDEELLSRSLRSRNPKVRSQVIETLEKTCETTIFRLLQPLVDEIPHEEKMRTYLKAGHLPLNLTALLNKMSVSSAQIDQIIAATMKYHLNLPDWRASLRHQMSRQDALFHHFAYELLET